MSHLLFRRWLSLCHTTQSYCPPQFWHVLLSLGVAKFQTSSWLGLTHRTFFPSRRLLPNHEISKCVRGNQSWDFNTIDWKNEANQSWNFNESHVPVAFVPIPSSAPEPIALCLDPGRRFKMYQSHPHLQPIPQACEGLGSGCSKVKERTFTMCHRVFFTGQAIYQWSKVFTPNFGPNTKKPPKKYEQVTVKRRKTCQHCTWSISTSGSAAAPPLATDSWAQRS